MMADTTNSAQEDQSMEEILQSIRRIIAEEGNNSAAAPEGSRPASSPDEGSDILELTDMVQDDGSVMAMEEFMPGVQPVVARTTESESQAEEVLSRQKKSHAPQSLCKMILLPILKR